MRAERSAVFGEALYRPGGSCGPRTQRDYQVVVLLSGEMRVVMQGVERSLPIGFAGLLRPGHREMIHFSSRTDSHHLWCAIAPDRLDGGLRRVADTAAFLSPLSPVMRGIFDAGLRVAGAGGRAEARVLDALATAAVAECVRASESGPVVSRPGSPAAVARDHLRTRYADRDALRTAAAAAAVSVQHLGRAFRKAYGVTPGQWLWDCRINAGLRMLQDTGHSVGEISDRCGFSNPFHFSRLIRARTGLPPRAWRGKMWGSG